MSVIALNAVSQTEFDWMVKAEYQSEGMLLNHCVQRRNDVIGSSYQFRKVGQVIAQPHVYGQYGNTQDPGYVPETAILVPYSVKIEHDIMQDQLVDFDVNSTNAKVVGYALGRRSDQIIINAWSSTTTPALPAAGTNFTYNKCRAIVQWFNQKAIPIRERFMIINGSALAELMDDIHFVNKLYTLNDFLDIGKAQAFIGFGLIVVPDMLEGGLPFDTGTATATCFAVHSQAAGFAVGVNFQTRTTYENLITSWLTTALFSGGSVVVDHLGVLPVDCYQPA